MPSITTAPPRGHVSPSVRAVLDIVEQAQRQAAASECALRPSHPDAIHLSTLSTVLAAVGQIAIEAYGPGKELRIGGTDDRTGIVVRVHTEGQPAAVASAPLALTDAATRHPRLLPVVANLCEEMTLGPSQALVRETFSIFGDLKNLLTSAAAKSLSPVVEAGERVALVHDGRRALACMAMIICAVAALPTYAVAWWPRPAVAHLRSTVEELSTLGATLDRAAAELGLPDLADPLTDAAKVAAIGGV